MFHSNFTIYICPAMDSQYCNKRVLSLTHTLILNVCLPTCIHGLHISTQHLDETLEPLNWIRVRSSRCHEHFCERSHDCNVWHLRSVNIQDSSNAHVLYFIYTPSNISNLNSTMVIHELCQAWPKTLSH